MRDVSMLGVLVALAVIGAGLIGVAVRWPLEALGVGGALLIVSSVVGVMAWIGEKVGGSSE